LDIFRYESAFYFFYATILQINTNSIATCISIYDAPFPSLIAGVTSVNIRTIDSANTKIAV